ncbi:STS14 protein [Neltuma alba]|uniref:STS14 protein n=1 Tax=Neltuma alba TaxID=207710 RepID=UPI0010A425CE|nr:STS14 protein [Prosopis alba]
MNLGAGLTPSLLTTDRARKSMKTKMVHLRPLFAVAFLAILQVSPSATTTAEVELPDAAKQFLDAHNQARAAVGVAPLQWSQKLANATSLLVRSQRNRMGCQFANIKPGTYGANQLWSGGETVTPRAAVEEWVKEKNYYNHANNSCVANHSCGVYTQVVWRKSLELGCAQASCVKEKASLTICFYNPPGNVVGESPY